MQVGEDSAGRDPVGRGQSRVLLLMALCLVLVLTLMLVSRRPAGGDGASATGTSTTPAIAGGAIGVAIPATALPGVEPRRAGDTPQAASADPAASRRHEFEKSVDLFDYTRRLLPAVREGDPEATWLLSRVVDECAAHAADPAAFARDTALLAGLGLPSARAVRAARERVDTRCRRFGPRDGLSQARVRQLRLEAAQAGALVAEAELLARGEPLSPDRSYSDDLLDRVDRAGDAQAFAALSTADQVSGWLSMLGQDVAPQYAPLVWQIAACRMGADCGPQSAVVTSYCVNGGICSRQAGQGFEEFVYDAAVPRQSADVVRGAVDALVERFGGRP